MRLRVNYRSVDYARLSLSIDNPSRFCYTEITHKGAMMANQESRAMDAARRQARKLWRCADCGDALPRAGYAWKDFVKAVRWERVERSGRRCDFCVDALEAC